MKKPSSIAITEPGYAREVEQTQPFARLDNLYRRIGALTALRELNLIIVLINNIDHVGEPRLEQAWFFETTDGVTGPFKWLQDQGKDSRVDQWTAR
ncbi:hypothetical protein BKA57DRAFT_508018 [Linnemannia elongata]|nr:hypothetical protein BKA57DRAFT_508018 [Linnemannia elongata]